MINLSPNPVNHLSALHSGAGVAWFWRMALRMAPGCQQKSKTPCLSAPSATLRLAGCEIWHATDGSKFVPVRSSPQPTNCGMMQSHASHLAVKDVSSGFRRTKKTSRISILWFLTLRSKRISCFKTGQQPAERFA
jgi:hypothetical protein